MRAAGLLALLALAPAGCLLEERSFQPSAGPDAQVDPDAGPGLIVTSASAVVVVEAGTQTLAVQLSEPPLPEGTVEIAVASTDLTNATATPQSLIFDGDNFDIDQLVTLGGVADPDLADDDSALELSGAGYQAATVPVTVDDDDVQAIELLGVASPLVLVEGTAVQVSVRLAFQPATPQLVTLTAAGDASVGPGALTFAPNSYASAQLITITALIDADAADGSGTVTASATGVPEASLPIVVTDDD